MTLQVELSPVEIDLLLWCIGAAESEFFVYESEFVETQALSEKLRLLLSSVVAV